MVIDFDEARARREAERPYNPILEALDTLAVALAGHGHAWTDRERELYESAVATCIG